MTETITESQHWLKLYTDSFKNQETNFGSLKAWVQDNISNVKEDVKSFVTKKTLKHNFSSLNDLLFVKFKQLEDTKAAVRDLIGFQTYYYPIQLQTAISENINELTGSLEDIRY